MFQFFETFFNIVSSVVNFFTSTFNSIVDLFQNALLGIGFISSGIQWMPGFLQPIFFTLLGVAVVKLILNMGGN